MVSIIDLNEQILVTDGAEDLKDLGDVKLIFKINFIIIRQSFTYVTIVFI